MNNQTGIMKIKKLLIFIFCITCANNLFAQVISKKANIIEVNTDNVIVENYYGGSVQWEPNDRDAMTEKQWDRLLQRVEFMELGYIRCCINAYYYCLGFSETNQPLYIWDTESIKKSDKKWIEESKRLMCDLYRILSFCQKHNIKVMLGDWGAPNNSHGAPPFIELQRYTLNWGDPKYAQISADLIEHLINDKKFTCISQFNLGNEVNMWPETISWHSWSTSMKSLYSNLQKKGLSDKIALVGPDGGYWSLLWFNETIDKLNKEVNVIDYHWYIVNDWLLTNRVEDEMRVMRFFTSLNNPKKENIFGEIGIRDGHIEILDQQSQVGDFWYGVAMTDALVQSMRAGWSAAVAWDMDDSMHYKDDTKHLKKWGFWNSIAEQKGNPEEANIRPWFYTWSLLSQHFTPGSKIYYSNSFGMQGINTVTAISSEGDISCVIVNNRDFGQNITVQIPNVINELQLNKYVYFENVRPIDKNGFPIIADKIKSVNLAKGISINLHSKGVVLLTTKGCTIKPILKKNEEEMFDTMDGLQLMYQHSENLGMNGFVKHYNECKENTPNFNFERVENDRSTIHPSTNDLSAYIVYKFNNLASFEISVSGKDFIKGRYLIYNSTDGITWTPVQFDMTTLKSSLWMWQHSMLYPTSPLKDCNYLKIEMIPLGVAENTRIRDVKLMK